MGKITQKLWIFLVVVLSPCLQTIQAKLIRGCSGIQYFDKGSCKCGFSIQNRTIPVLIECEYAGFTEDSLKTALTNLPKSVDLLKIRGDHLVELPLNLFGKSEDLHLEILDLSNNYIGTIHDKTFQNANTIKNLILDDNNLYFENHVNMFSNFKNLTMLSLNNAFDGKIAGSRHVKQLNSLIYAVAMEKLEYLYLNDNRLTNRTLRSLEYLPALKELQLSHNKVEYVDLLFDWLNSIEKLNLSGNSIHGLTYGALVALDTSYLDRKGQAKEQLLVDLTGNPFDCGCKGKRFVEWLHTTNVNIYRKETIKCALPFNMRGKTVLSLNQDDINCEKVTKEATKRNNARYIVVGVLACIIIIAAMGILYLYAKYRKGFRCRWPSRVTSPRYVHL